MSIRCRCLLVRDGEKPVWSDKELRLPPRAGDGVQFEDRGTLFTFRIAEVLHTPGLDGVDFALLLTEQEGTRGRPFRELLEETAGAGPTR
ncbi:hypothetical protein [Arenibaculum sp.]|jgi:hypothetical protein|uniref:hypothetical protein n=1 Tax=Arenibaculum sp. TaxID=2865862 RepID=UPI002E0EF6FC|nr:hypothetical protein [Arenibaculum sp.]